MASDEQQSNEGLDILTVYENLAAKFLILPNEQDFLLRELLPECEPARDGDEGYSDSDSTLVDTPQFQDCLEE